MSHSTPQRGHSWTGAHPWRLLATLAVGVVLYLALPRFAPLPEAKMFAGAVSEKTKPDKPKTKPEATSPPAGGSPIVSSKTSSEAQKASAPKAPPEPQKAEAKADQDSTLKAKAEAEARATLESEKKRQEDWIHALHLFAIFVATIVGIILRPLPMGAVALIGVMLTALTGTLPIKDSLSGFSEKTLWLIVAAFMFARGFIKTGLGNRIAFFFMRLLGKRTLGLAYGLAATDLALAPVIPSNTGRAGGVIMPVMRSLARAYGSNPEDGTARKMGAFLTLSAFQADVVTSAMFLTAMAANPLAQKLAGDLGVKITWGSWALAAIVPGLISLLIIPYVLYRFYKPEVTETPEAVVMARTKLAEMGRMSLGEWLMTSVFSGVLLLWIFGENASIDATTSALLGLGLLVVTGVLTWRDVLEETNAWDVLIWTGALIMMAGFLNKLGLIPWFSKVVGASMAGHGWHFAFLVLGLTYFYAHYFFASMTAHVGAMYAAFLGVAITLGAPPVLAALVLCFFSNLFASMTHYGTGPAAAMFGLGYVPIGTWWRLGFIVSVLNILIWVGIGGTWWKVLGLW